MDRDEEKVQNVIDYHETFGSEHGKRCLEHLKKKAKFNASAIPKDNRGCTDPYEMMRQEGQRSVIVHIELMLKKDPYEKKGIKND